MPARDLFLRYQRDMSVTEQWWIQGDHYARTCESWLSKLDRQADAAKRALESATTSDAPDILVQRWRMFFMACAELFKFDGGNQWGVGHYVFETNDSAGRS